MLQGPSLTMGDIPLGCWVNRYLRLSETGAFERPALPHVVAWYERLQQEAAYVQLVSSLDLS
jgi:glutathione S-transferase